MSHGTSLVAEPDNTSKSPLANGSSVPACPVLALVLARISRMTANEDGPGGLSTRISPVGLSARGGTMSALSRGLGRSCELAPDELDQLVERKLARESRRLPVAASL